MRYREKEWQVKEIGRGRKTKVIRKEFETLVCFVPDRMKRYTGKVYVFGKYYGDDYKFLCYRYVGVCDLKNGIVHNETRAAYRSENGYKEWRVEGKLHRIDGPAVEWADGSKEWWIDWELFSKKYLEYLTKVGIFLGKEKGRYNLEWLKFLTEERIEEFPIIPGMETYKPFTCLFGQVFGVVKK